MDPTDIPRRTTGDVPTMEVLQPQTTDPILPQI
jgi:hypothetical protein